MPASSDAKFEMRKKIRVNAPPSAGGAIHAS
jgi:hypothetical protein